VQLTPTLSIFIDQPLNGAGEFVANGLDSIHSFGDILHFTLFSVGDAVITPIKVLYLFALMIVVVAVSRIASELLSKRILSRTRFEDDTKQTIGSAVHWTILVIGMIAILMPIGIDIKTLIGILNYNFFALGNAKITPLTVFYLILLTVVLLFLSRKLVDLLVKKILTRTALGLGARQAIGTIARYLVLFLGFILILETVGIDLTTLNVLAGAFAVGIGFGLQNIFNNFVSGLIVLLERPVQVGDRIEVNGVNGKVMAIGPRATRIKTNDNFTIIVPNSKLISENVINWSYRNDIVRIRVPVLVAPATNVALVKQLMLDAANEHPDVSKEPIPSVSLLKFDADGLSMELGVWSRVAFHKPGALQSQLNFALIDKFRANDVKVSKANNGGPPVSLSEDDEDAENNIDKKTPKKESGDKT